MNNFAEFLDSYKNKNTDYFNIVELIRVNDIEYKSMLHSTNHSLLSYNMKSNYGMKPTSPNMCKSYDMWKTDHEVDVSFNIEQKEIIIECEVHTLSDLIQITNDHAYDKLNKYNIDLKTLHMIKNELIQLNDMIGMKELKSNVLNQILYFIQNLHIHNDESDYKHTVLYGPPGTGKTEVAEIIGKMYSKMGVLKKNIFRKVNRSDLIAGYLGQTALKTTDVINSCIGGCLFIDEVYALGSDESYSKECIDTLNECLSRHKNNLMVIIAGYEDDIKHQFFSANKGLESRFIWRFQIDPYNSEELYHIFCKKVKNIDWSLDDSVQSKWFEKHKDNFKYYGRDVEMFLSHIKVCHSRRVFGNPNEKKHIKLCDLDSALSTFLKHKDKQVILNHYI
jgi:SpoVK/Ycf46/Vps4 family AAA+-type ATPase